MSSKCATYGSIRLLVGIVMDPPDRWAALWSTKARASEALGGGDDGDMLSVSSGACTKRLSIRGFSIFRVLRQSD